MANQKKHPRGSRRRAERRGSMRWPVQVISILGLATFFLSMGLLLSESRSFVSALIQAFVYASVAVLVAVITYRRGGHGDT